MSAMLELVAHLPEIEIAGGEVLCAEGSEGGTIWILVSGSLSVTRRDVVVGTIDGAGAVIGEMSVLLDTTHGATVTARVPTRLRVAIDGVALLRDHPMITTHVAAGLAERLQFVSTYLADLKHQYGDTPGLAMIDTVLNELVARQDAPARPGSSRDPEPLY